VGFCTLGASDCRERMVKGDASAEASRMEHKRRLFRKCDPG